MKDSRYDRLWLTAAVMILLLCWCREGRGEEAKRSSTLACARIVLLAVDNPYQIKVNVGADDGVKVGDLMQVYRGNEYLGEIVIRATGPDKSIGRIDKPMLLGKLQKGDQATSLVRRRNDSIPITH